MSEWPGVGGGGPIAPSMIGGIQQDAAEPRWWNPLDSAAIDATTIEAYRAQASVGSPWPFAPANYAETLQNWANPGVNDLLEGAGAVPWAANTGWQFTAAASQYLNTLVSGADNDWVMFIQFDNLLTANSFLCGGRSQAFDIQIRTAIDIVYNHRTATLVPPGINTGNVGMVEQIGYRNGVNDGAIGDITVPLARNLLIGCTNNAGVPTGFCTAYIAAVLICNDASAWTVADITALAALPGGSMQNL